MLQKIGIVGCGLIGGSIARDCVARGLNVAVATRNPEKVLTYIAGVKLCQSVDAMPPCDVLVVAVPLSTYGAVLQDIGSSHGIVTDVGSVRGYVAGLTSDIANFVGSHPIAGSEISGVENSKNDLFAGKKVIIDSDKIADFWLKLGAMPKIMSSRDHDVLYAKLSHLPHLIAFVFDDMINKEDLQKQDARLVSSYNDYKDFRRIGLASRYIWEGEFGIFKLNKDNIIRIFVDFIAKIKKQKPISMGIVSLARAISTALTEMLDADDKACMGGSITSMIQMTDSVIHNDLESAEFSVDNFLTCLNNKINLI